ncbi:MAG: hypothetical protein JW909_09180 [Planctomycetes bacterium]|nr:hypothetical protein [Planctomycetota bacterium]
MVRHHRDEYKRKLADVEKRLEELLDCITPENKDLISQKMVALRKERDRLQAELGNTAEIEEKAVASTKLVGRLVELAKEFRELWGVATLAEKKEFLSLLTNSISIYPERKMAEISLSHNYCEAKHLLKIKGTQYLIRFWLRAGFPFTEQSAGLLFKQFDKSIIAQRPPRAFMFHKSIRKPLLRDITLYFRAGGQNGDSPYMKYNVMSLLYSATDLPPALYHNRAGTSAQ